MAHEEKPKNRDRPKTAPWRLHTSHAPSALKKQGDVTLSSAKKKAFFDRLGVAQCLIFLLVILTPTS